MDQRTRVLLVGGFILLAAIALGVQAAAIDRETDVTQIDEKQIYPGNTLIGVHSWENDGRIVEIDASGEVVWKHAIENARFFGIDPLREGEEAPGIVPESDGDVVLFALGEIVPAEECPDEYLRHEQGAAFDPPAQDHCVLNRVVLMDRGADRDRHDVVWEYEWYDEMIHWHEVHDTVVTADGEVAIIDMGKHRVFTVDEAGEITWEWRAEEHIDEGTEFFEEHVVGSEHVNDPDAFAKQHPWDDWTHMNDIVELESGNFHLSIRNYDILIEVDPETDEIVDTIGEPGNKSLMDHQHNPQHLEEHGTVVVADSGNNRIIELDVDTEEIIWTYNGPDGDPLLWPRDADRLPNGNTLITDSRNNRILEIDADGEVVWEYRDPDGDLIPLPYAADRLPVGETAGGPPAYELGESEEVDHGIVGDVREVETLAHWVLPTWMHLPQQLNLLALALGGLWLVGEGALYGARRLRLFERIRSLR